MTLRARAAGSVTVVLVLVGTLVASAPPAAALHQYCGVDAEGVHLDGYPKGTLANGHSDEFENPGGGNWAGAGATGKHKQAVYGLERTEKHLGNLIAILDKASDNIPAAKIALAQAIVKEALAIARTALGASILELEARSAEINACGSVFLGDMVDLLFVAGIEEELAALGAARASGSHGDGARLAPTATLMLPDDGNPHWTPDAKGYHGYTGHSADDLADIQFNDGFANDPYLGVATVTRNAIAHLVAHGVDVGNARELWDEAMGLLKAGYLREAHAKFAEAYYVAVSTPESLNH